MSLPISPECVRCGARNSAEATCCRVCTRRAGTPLVHSHDCPGTPDYPCLACEVERVEALI